MWSICLFKPIYIKYIPHACSKQFTLNMISMLAQSNLHSIWSACLLKTIYIEYDPHACPKQFTLNFIFLSNLPPFNPGTPHIVLSFSLSAYCNLFQVFLCGPIDRPCCYAMCVGKSYLGVKMTLSVSPWILQHIWSLGALGVMLVWVLWIRPPAVPAPAAASLEKCGKSESVEKCFSKRCSWGAPGVIRPSAGTSSRHLQHLWRS